MSLLGLTKREIYLIEMLPIDSNSIDASEDLSQSNL